MSIHKCGIFQIFPAFRVAFVQLVELNPPSFRGRRERRRQEVLSAMERQFNCAISIAGVSESPARFSHFPCPARRTVRAPRVANERISPSLINRDTSASSKARHSVILSASKLPEGSRSFRQPFNMTIR